MRLGRVVALAAGALVLVLILIIVALLLFVHPDNYRGRIQAAVQQQTGRELTIGGKLELKVFPWLAVSVQNLSLGNAPQFGPQPFLTVQHASIGVRVLPLLFARRLEVSRIAIDGLSAHLVKRGTANNWEDLTESKGRKPQAPPQTSTPNGSLTVGAIDIKDCVVIYSDETAKSTTTLRLDELRSGRISLGGAPSALSLEDFELKGSVLSEAPGKPAGSAKPLPFSLRAPRLALDPDTRTLAPARLEAHVGDLAVIMTASGQKSAAGQVLSGRLEIPKVSPRRVMESLGSSPPAMRDPHGMSVFALTSNYRFSPNRLELSALDLTLDDTRVTGTAAINDLAHDALAFNLKVNAINLDRYRPPAPAGAAPGQKGPPAGAQPAQPPTPLPIETLRKLDAHGTLEVGSATFAGLAFTAVRMPLAAQGGLIHLGPGQALVYGGTYNGDIVLDARPAQAELALNQHVHGTDIGALLKAGFDTTRLSGHADVDAAVKGTGNTNAAIMSSLGGKIEASVKQGALNGIDIAYELQSANALLKRQAPPGRAGPARTVFNTLQTSGTLERGVLHTDVLRIETDFMKVSGTGTLNITTEAIDYRLLAMLSQGAPANRSGAAASPAGLDVPLLVTGTAASPTVRPDLESLAKGQLRQKANDLIKKQLGDKLKGLLPH